MSGMPIDEKLNCISRVPAVQSPAINVCIESRKDFIQSVSFLNRKVGVNRRLRAFGDMAVGE
jgi:hypothetical protein